MSLLDRSGEEDAAFWADAAGFNDRLRAFCKRV
jgi:hypothetical protein